MTSSPPQQSRARHPLARARCFSTFRANPWSVRAVLRAS